MDKILCWFGIHKWILPLVGPWRNCETCDKMEAWTTEEGWTSFQGMEGIENEN